MCSSIDVRYMLYSLSLTWNPVVWQVMTGTLAMTSAPSKTAPLSSKALVQDTSTSFRMEYCDTESTHHADLSYAA